ncbi:hypothetical protein DFH06DRAFT_1435963 [Mycena polygramma]|nr:hypothetical protein DFH06DRAFT_1435963 [Mycena polygramma]
MHRALELPELLGMVCDEVYRTCYGPSKALYSLAQVCRGFSEPALDNIWKTQDTLTNVLACMPEDLWDVFGNGSSSHLVARRAIEPDDWDRFHVYARRVKNLSFSDYTDNRAAWLPVFRMLAVWFPGDQKCMFPNLRSLKWGIFLPLSFPYVRLFLWPRLEAITLDGLATEAVLALLLTLPERCPLLKYVKLWTHPLPHTLTSPPISMMIRGLMRLESLHVGTIDQSAFEHLAQLPTLKYLTIRAPSFIPSPSPDALRLPGLLDAMLPHPPTPEAMTSLLTLLVERCDRTALAHLSLDILSARPLPLATRPPPPTPIPFTILQSLFCFGNLRHVDIAPPAGFDLDDVAVDALARAWPRLQRLQLPVYRQRSPRVTLCGLRSIARHCRDLVFLAVPFDALTVPEEDAPSAAERGKMLRTLGVEDSSLVDPPAVAAYLYALFPNVDEVLTGGLHRGDDGWRARARELWTQVEQLYADAAQASLQ